MFKFSYYANLVTDDVINCASIVVWHKIKNISANNEATVLKIGMDIAPYEIYQTVHILMLLWQHARFQFPASSKWNIPTEIYYLWLNKAKYLVLSKTQASPTFIGSPL